MKIRIVEPGWENFSDWLGPVQFVDGVSVEDIGSGEINRISGIVRVENVETGLNPSLSQRIIDDNRKSLADLHGMSAHIPPAANSAPVVEAVADTKVYTEDELGAIADASGIKGVRAISDPRGLKGTSIAALIGAILTQQSAAAEEARKAAELEAEKAAEAAAGQDASNEGADPAAEEAAKAEVESKASEGSEQSVEEGKKD